MPREAQVFLSLVGIGLVILLAALTYYSRAVFTAQVEQGIISPQRITADGCTYDAPEYIQDRTLAVMGVATMRYPGGWHWRVECPDGNTFHVRIPRP